MQSLVSALLWDAEVSFYRRFRVIDSVWHRPAVQTKLATACGCDFGCVCTFFLEKSLDVKGWFQGKIGWKPHKLSPSELII